jgi:putative nucleotidyltransferase with HDIG domain
MGLTIASGLWELTLGALLHDIGKSRVPPKILNKKGRLTEEEFEIVKKHVEWGVEIASKTPAVPKDAYHAISQHHERLSGKGYPAGIKDLHQFGLIVAVADTSDAITTNRPSEK